jgi:hypothetical protein
VAEVEIVGAGVWERAALTDLVTLSLLGALGPTSDDLERWTRDALATLLLGGSADADASGMAGSPGPSIPILTLE